MIRFKGEWFDGASCSGTVERASLRGAPGERQLRLEGRLDDEEVEAILTEASGVRDRFEGTWRYGASDDEPARAEFRAYGDPNARLALIGEYWEDGEVVSWAVELTPLRGEDADDR